MAGIEKFKLDFDKSLLKITQGSETHDVLDCMAVPGAPEKFICIERFTSPSQNQFKVSERAESGLQGQVDPSFRHFRQDSGDE